MKKTGLFIILSSVCLIVLIPRTFKKQSYINKEVINNCKLESFWSLFKKLSIIALFLMNTYRIYFYCGWLYYIYFIPADRETKTKMGQVMSYQRGYRTIYYGIISLISSILFLLGSILEYKKLKYCLFGYDNAINEIYKFEKKSLFIICIILFLFCLEFYYIQRLVFIVLKNWKKINYGLGEITILKDIFFFRKINFIHIIYFFLFYLLLFFKFKYKLFNF